MGQSQGHVLTWKKYEFWSITLKSFLRSQECWEIVEGGLTKQDYAIVQTMTNAQRAQLNTQSKR